jgi:hypothetical protein
MPHPMPFFGSVSLLLALALSVYTLLAGTLSLWAIAHGRALAVAPERIRETAAAPASPASSPSPAPPSPSPGPSSPTTSPSTTSSITAAAPFRVLQVLSIWAGQEGSLLLWAWLLAAYGFVLRLRHKTDITPPRLRLHHPRRRADLLPSAGQLRRLPFAFAPGGSRQTASASIRCCNTPRWSSIRRCSTSATSASRFPSPSLSAR